MPALTTKFWADHKRIKREAALDAELDEFLGMEEIDHANQGLSDAMEVGDEDPIKSYIETTVNDRFKRLTSKEKAKQRKNSSADTANQESPPKKSGRDGKAKGKKRNEKERGRLKKRSPKRYDDETSYESEDRACSRSYRRHEKDDDKSSKETLPKSILKHGVTWRRDVSRSLSKEKPRERYSRQNNPRTDSSGRGRGGRGRGGRGESRNGGRGRGGRKK